MRCSIRRLLLPAAVLSFVCAGCEHTPTGAGAVAANHFRVELSGNQSGGYEGEIPVDTATAIPPYTLDMTSYDPPSPRELRIYRVNGDTTSLAAGRYVVKKDVYVTYIVGYGLGDPDYRVFQGTGGVLQVASATPDHFAATLDALAELPGGLQTRIRATVDMTHP